MTVNETRKYEMFVRVREFGDTRGDLFPKSTLAAKAFAEVGAVVDELGQHAVSKMSAHREAARSTAAARGALYERLVAMHNTARVIARDTADLEGKFLMPKTKGAQALATAGTLFARDAEPFAPQFIARAMPKSFIKDLLGLVETLETAIKARQEEQTGRTAARMEIRKTIARGMAAVQALDAMVVNHLHDDTVGQAVWDGARRIGHRRLGSRRVPASGAKPEAPNQETPSSPQATAPQPVAATTPPADNAAADSKQVDQKVA